MTNYNPVTAANSPFADISDTVLNSAIARARQALKFSMPSGVGVPGFRASESDAYAERMSFLDANMVLYSGSIDMPRGIYVRYSEAPKDSDGFPLYGAPRAHAFAKGTGDYWRLTVRL